MPSFFAASPSGTAIIENNQAIDLQQFSCLYKAIDNLENLQENTLVLINYVTRDQDETSISADILYAEHRKKDKEFCASNREYADIPYHLTILRKIDGYLELLADLSTLETSIMLELAPPGTDPQILTESDEANVQTLQLPRSWKGFVTPNNTYFTVKPDTEDTDKFTFDTSGLDQKFGEINAELNSTADGSLRGAIANAEASLADAKNFIDRIAIDFNKRFQLIDYEHGHYSVYQLENIGQTENEDIYGLVETSSGAGGSFSIEDFLPDTWIM